MSFKPLVLMLFILVSGNANSCQCLSSTYLEKWEKATFVFSAKVSRTEEVRKCSTRDGATLCSSSEFVIAIEPTISHKGDASSLSKVRTRNPGIHCGARVENDKEYLFFAFESATDVWVSNCSRPIEKGTELEQLFWKGLDAELQEQTLQYLNKELAENHEQ